MRKFLALVFIVGLCGFAGAASLQFTDSKISEIHRDAEGAVVITLTHSGQGLSPVTQVLTLKNAKGIDLGVIRQAAITQITALNDNLKAEDNFLSLVGTSLDITTPIPKPLDQVATEAFIELRRREVSLRVSVAAGSAEQTGLDAAILARKTAYAAGSETQKITFDDIMRMIP